MLSYKKLLYRFFKSKNLWKVSITTQLIFVLDGFNCLFHQIETGF